MNHLRAGYEKLRKHTEQVGDKVLKPFQADVATGVKDRLATRRQYVIRGRTIAEERQISEGGFAYVWKVRDIQTNEELALKKIHCQDQERLSMACREVELLEKLPQHPNLVRYFGETNNIREPGRPKEVSVLLELCPGGHLLDLLEKHKGVLSEQKILDVFTDVVRGVAVLHTLSPPVAHRDLKVENVLLGADGKFKLCDFGSWSDVESDVSTMDRQQLGALEENIHRYTTMMYRPPEMVDFYQSFRISVKVDIWMLGCVLFTLMYYRHPFQDESALAIANARYHIPPAPEFSDKLQDLVHWQLARCPDERPSALEVLGVLENFQDLEPLPLPEEVLQRRDKDRRLYSNNEQSAPSVPSGPRRAGPSLQVPSAASPGSSSNQKEFSPDTSDCAERPRRHKKKGHSRQSSGVDDMWGQAALVPPEVVWPMGGSPCSDGGGLWPPSAAAPPPIVPSVPAPSLAWANFDFDEQAAAAAAAAAATAAAGSSTLAPAPSGFASAPGPGSPMAAVGSSGSELGNNHNQINLVVKVNSNSSATGNPSASPNPAASTPGDSCPTPHAAPTTTVITVTTTSTGGSSSGPSTSTAAAANGAASSLVVVPGAAAPAAGSAAAAAAPTPPPASPVLSPGFGAMPSPDCGSAGSLGGGCAAAAPSVWAAAFEQAASEASSSRAGHLSRTTSPQPTTGPAWGPTWGVDRPEVDATPKARAKPRLRSIGRTCEDGGGKSEDSSPRRGSPHRRHHHHHHRNEQPQAQQDFWSLAAPAHDGFGGPPQWPSPTPAAPAAAPAAGAAGGGAAAKSSGAPAAEGEEARCPISGKIGAGCPMATFGIVKPKAKAAPAAPSASSGGTGFAAGKSLIASVEQSGSGSGDDWWLSRLCPLNWDEQTTKAFVIVAAVSWFSGIFVGWNLRKAILA